MRRIVGAVLAAMLVLLSSTAGAQAEPLAEPFAMPDGAVYEPEVALVGVREGTDALEVAATLAAVEGVDEEDVQAEEVCDGVVRVEFGDGIAVEDAVNDLLSSGVALDAQPNYRYLCVDGEQDVADPLALSAASDGLAAAGSVSDPGISGQWALASMQVEEAWSLAKASGAVTVAVLDLGCDVGHADLKANVVAAHNSYNAVHGGSQTDVTPATENHSHGTHVAGIISAVSNNGIGVSGVSYNARIMPIKVVDDAGVAYTETLVEAYDYLMRNASAYNVRVVNLSMGAAGPIGNDDKLLKKIDEAYGKGIVTVSCAGNRSAQGTYGFPYDCYPGDYDKVVSVINLAQSGSGVTKSSESNYNRPGEREKNVSAPGTLILSTVPGGDYGYMSGTSMATPHVSAVLALEFVANPALSADKAVEILYNTATDLGASGWDETYGHGEANAYRAVKAAKELAQTPSSTWKRLAGATRYDTMAAIVQEGFSSASSWAVVATGGNYPDALAASALAGARKCPVVLTEPQALSAQALAQLKRLGVKNVCLMGGAGAVGAAVEDALVANGMGVTRVAGADRQATSLAAYEATRAAGSASKTVVVATGKGFADALSIGPWAYATSSPVVLAASDGSLTPAEVAAIKADKKVARVVLLGGASAVSDAVRTQLGSGYEYVRLAGADRYATSQAIASWEVGEGLKWASMGVATGAAFPDALAGAALCGSKSSVLVLASKTSDPTVGLTRSHVADVSRGYLLGGTVALPNSLAVALG